MGVFLTPCAFFTVTLHVLLAWAVPSKRLVPREAGRAKPLESWAGRGRRTGRVRRLLLAADLAALVLAFAAVDGYRLLRGAPNEILVEDLPLLLAGLPFWVCFAYAFGLYHMQSRRVEHSVADEIAPIWQMTALWGWSMVIVVTPLGLAQPGVGQLAVFWLTATVYRERALVVGTGAQVDSLVQKVERHPEYAVDVVACVDHAAGSEPWPQRSVPVLGDSADVISQVSTLGIDRVFQAWSPTAEDHEERFELARELSERGVRVDLLPSWFEVLGARLELHELEGLPVLTVPFVRLGRTSLRVKRAFDLTVSAVVLLVLVPVLILCALAIKLDSRGPVFFHQRRIGKDGKSFSLVKFRSMHADADVRKQEVRGLSFHGDGLGQGMFKIRRDPRITRVGAFLRRTSLDELPQLFNILRGEMSLVGPRPLIEDEDRQVEGRFRRRLDLTPGLTGLWQIHGRSEIPLQSMISLDYLYVTSWSLWGDIKILMKTVPAVTGRRGAY
jgi:exopolysaccharide biosynthesis polyprenyl glycosylphosphotransferase